MSAPGRLIVLLASSATGLALVACIATDGGGYYDGGGAYYAGGYYEPYQYGYGGWGRGYHVAPGRGGARGDGRGNHSYRSAPAGRGAPSMPSRARKH